jgi:S1-C subfamily serine protease
MRRRLLPRSLLATGNSMRRMRATLAIAAAATAALLAVSGTLLGQQNAQNAWVEELASAVVRIKTHINPEGRTIEGLGRERDGSGIVIDTDGLVLTIGYLMVEAYAAEVVDNGGHTVPANVVGYDHETGFGLLRTSEPLKVKPLGLGKSAQVKERDPVLIASYGGSAMVGPAYVVAKREFAGSWEYLLDEALFTAPPHPAWSGAALINSEGKLVGVGSLIVSDATAGSDKTPGNMFVPIDRLPPILGDLIADGRVAGPGRPWLGVNAEELRGRLLVGRATPGGPAEKAGIKRGDIIVGVKGERARGLADFYRKVWAQGPAGANIPLDVLQDNEVRRLDVKSINRLDYLKLKSTF